MSQEQEPTRAATELHRAANLAEAHAIRLLLEANGVPAWIDNEALQGTVGELPLGWATAPRVLVAPKDEAAARQLLAERPASHPAPETAPGTAGAAEIAPEGRLRCLACGAPMGGVAACPACGWSYAASDDAKDDETVDDADDDAAVAQPVPPREPVRWGELIAVAVVAVGMPMASTLGMAASHVGEPDRQVALGLSRLLADGGAAYVVLYLIARGGDGWARYGIVPPSWRDLAGALPLAAATWLCYRPFVDGPTAVAEPLNLWTATTHWLVPAFAEEVGVRAYLIVRLAVVLGSRTLAVGAAAAAFASYHVYMGIGAVPPAFLMGLVFGIAFVAFRRLWPLVLGHWLHNVLSAAAWW